MVATSFNAIPLVVMGDTCPECAGKLVTDHARNERVCQKCGLVAGAEMKESWAPLPSQDFTHKRRKPSAIKQRKTIKVEGRVRCPLCNKPLLAGEIVRGNVSILIQFKCPTCPVRVSITLAQGVAELRAFAAAEKRAREEFGRVREEALAKLAQVVEAPKGKRTGRPAVPLTEADVARLSELFGEYVSYRNIAKTLSREWRKAGIRKSISESGIKRRVREFGWSR